jgi:hypothetical protein
MPAIFISYRRDDTLSATGRLADALAARFGTNEVFRDLQAIDAGVDFRVALNAALETARVVLVMIGRSWVVPRATASSNLSESDDYVRMEIETALTQDVPIIPVLVEGARMPTPEELPASIRALAYRHAHEISESRWAYDTGRLLDIVTREGGIGPVASSGTSRGFERVRSRPFVGTLISAPIDFLRLLSEPRRFLAARGAESQADLGRAIVFVLVSQLVAAALVLQEWPTRSSVPQFVITAPLLKLLGGLALSLPLYQAWRLVGAPRAYPRVLVIVLYQCGFIGLGVAAAMLAALIGMNMTVQDAVDQFARDTTVRGFSAFLARLESAPENRAWIITSMISSLIAFALLVWSLVTWGSYRRALDQSRLRSGLALALFTLLCLAPIAVLAWVASVL